MGEVIERLGMGIRAEIIPPPNIPNIWREINTWLSESLAHDDGSFQLEDYYMSLIGNSMQLVVAKEGNKLLGCALTEIIRYPRKRVLHVQAFGGTSPAWAWSKILLMELVRMSKLLKIDKITAQTYPAMARALRRYGFVEQAILLSRDLK